MEYILMLPNRKAKYYWIDGGLFICGLILLLVSKWIPGVLLLAMAVMGFLIRKNPYPHFTGKGIKIHMVWVKHHNWSELNSCMLKDGMLSLDFANNKLFQEVIVSTSVENINEDEFSSFCGNKIEEAAQKSQSSSSS